MVAANASSSGGAPFARAALIVIDAARSQSPTASVAFARAQSRIACARSTASVAAIRSAAAGAVSSAREYAVTAALQSDPDSAACPASIASS
jgi:hypothetical protein